MKKQKRIVVAILLAANAGIVSAKEITIRCDVIGTMTTPYEGVNKTINNSQSVSRYYVLDEASRHASIIIDGKRNRVCENGCTEIYSESVIVVKRQSENSRGETKIDRLTGYLTETSSIGVLQMDIRGPCTPVDVKSRKF